MESNIQKIPIEIISKKIVSYLSPKTFNRLSIVSKNIYLLEIYKDNYLYYDSGSNDFWKKEDYDHKKDYIYRYKSITKFINQYIKESMSEYDINELLYRVTTKDQFNYVINLGADVNFVGGPEVSPLVFRSNSRVERPDLTRGLLENGAYIQETDMFNKTAYYLALKNGYMNTIDIFSEYKYNILNDLYYYQVITPDFVNIISVDIELLTDKLKNINYDISDQDINIDLIINIIKSCIDL